MAEKVYNKCAKSPRFPLPLLATNYDAFISSLRSEAPPVAGENATADGLVARLVGSTNNRWVHAAGASGHALVMLHEGPRSAPADGAADPGRRSLLPARRGSQRVGGRQAAAAVRAARRGGERPARRHVAEWQGHSSANSSTVSPLHENAELLFLAPRPAELPV